MLPPQQRATEHASFNPYIYDLTKQAKDYLFDLGLSDPTVRPTGHWWHGYMTSCVTSSIDIAAAHKGVRYIPAHEILALAIKNAPLAIPIGGQKLIPDQLFALGYGGSYRVFALEVDNHNRWNIFFVQDFVHAQQLRKSIFRPIIVSRRPMGEFPVECFASG